MARREKTTLSFVPEAFEPLKPSSMGVIRSVADRRSWDPARTSGYENKVTGALFVLFRCLVQCLFQFFYHG